MNKFQLSRCNEYYNLARLIIESDVETPGDDDSSDGVPDLEPVDDDSSDGVPDLEPVDDDSSDGVT